MKEVKTNIKKLESIINRMIKDMKNEDIYKDLQKIYHNEMENSYSMTNKFQMIITTEPVGFNPSNITTEKHLNYEKMFPNLEMENYKEVEFDLNKLKEEFKELKNQSKEVKQNLEEQGIKKNHYTIHYLYKFAEEYKNTCVNMEWLIKMLSALPNCKMYVGERIKPIMFITDNTKAMILPIREASFDKKNNYGGNIIVQR